MAFWTSNDNVFDNVSKRSMRKMLVLTNDHLSKLKAEKADAAINALFLRTEPLHLAFSQCYIRRANAKGIYKGHSAKMNGLLKKLRQLKVKQWDVQIQNHYLQGTAEYTILMPQRRRPFQSYAIDTRISRIKALSKSLEAFPAMAAIKNDVDDFFTIISEVRDVQQQHEEHVARSISNLEIARKELAIMMYRNLGVLMDKFAHQPSIISNFWQVSVLKQ